MKKNFKDEKLKRAMIAFKCDKVNDFASLFNTSPQNINGYLDRGTFVNFIQNETLKRGISIDWIITGQGEMFIQRGNSPVSESTAMYKTSNTPNNPTIHSQSDTSQMLSKTACILESGSIFAKALSSNIDAFHFGLTLQRDLSATQAILQQHSDMIRKQQDRLDTVESLLSSMKKKETA